MLRIRIAPLASERMVAQTDVKAGVIAYQHASAHHGVWNGNTLFA